MLDFMIIGLPRSGTTWASNWLTTDAVHCVHDPLYTTHYSDWDHALPRDHAPSAKHVGVSCTGIWRWAGWVNDHPARKVILHRDLGEVRKSMVEIGLPDILTAKDAAALDEIIGYHVPYDSLFDPTEAKLIWDYLVPGQVFNEDRHRALVQIEMQPQFAGLSVGPEVTRRLINELENIL